MIKIENIICEIKNMCDHIMFCVSGKLFVYLLQIKLHLIRKHHFILHNSLCKMPGKTVNLPYILHIVYSKVDLSHEKIKGNRT